MSINSQFACRLTLACVLALAACGPKTDRLREPQNDVAVAAQPAPARVATPGAETKSAILASDAASALPECASTGPRACAAQIGAKPAAAKVKLCRSVSPATHPPCNAANSCAMIDDEIARSCALFDDKGAPVPGCTPAPKSPEAAAAVVQRYYAALNARDYDTAWNQWGQNGPPSQSRARFAAGFAHTRSTHVRIGRLPPGDAGAGSLYQPVPVVVDATLDTGARQRFIGNYILRRVNDIDGATAAQLRWHISAAQLKTAPLPQ